MTENAKPFSAEGVRAFRETFRQEHVSPAYRGRLHAVFLVTLPLAAILAALAQLRQPRWLDFLVLVPLLVLGSLFVFVFHKYVLHRPLGPLRGLYVIHALQHHRFFSHEVVTYDDPRDLAIVFFPWFAPVGVIFVQMPLFYFAGRALGASPDVALIASTINPIYYLLYELFHFASHVSESSWLLRVPFLRAMREHHTLHHDPRLMAHHNFNVVFPLFDWLFGARIGRAEATAKDLEPRPG